MTNIEINTGNEVSTDASVKESATAALQNQAYEAQQPGPTGASPSTAKPKDVTLAEATSPDSQITIPRLDHFDDDKNVDHFRPVDWHVTASGRLIAGQTSLDTLATDMHPGLANIKSPEAQQKALATDEKNTAIIDLRTYDDPDLKTPGNEPWLAENNKGMTAERDELTAHGGTYVNMPILETMPAQTPQYIKSIVDTMHQLVQSGKDVDVHCYYGTDRTGLVTAAYKATYDKDLQNLIHSPGEQGVEKAYLELNQYLLSNGSNPSNYSTAYSSLRQYLQFLHDGKNGDVVTPTPSVALDAAQEQTLKTAQAQFQQPNNAELATYENILKQTNGRFDPATHSAFYKALDAEFKQAYTDQHSQK